MRFRFRPTDDSFYDFFIQGGVEPGPGHRTALRAGHARRPTSPSIAERLEEVEHDSDRITHDVYNKINSTFITPFDREDIYRLASTLDDVMDHIEAAGNLVYLYGLTKLPALPREMHEIVHVLDQQARVTAAAMPRLRSMKDLKEYWVEINRLENEGDRAYRMLLVRLFSGEYDALHGAQDEGGRRRAGEGVRRLRARGEHGRDRSRSRSPEP